MLSRKTVKMKKIVWHWFCTVLDYLFVTIRFLFYCVLLLKYGDKGKIVSAVKNPLLLKSATKLAQEIREGKLKSEEVVQAYIDRIIEVDPLINATVDRCFEDAIKKAREVDSLIASRSYSKDYLSKEKPLLGVPFTIKHIFMVKGLRCTAGYKGFENLKATRDAPVVTLMKRSGAILIASTNIPELPCNVGCKNKLHGSTYNPYNTVKTSGGSSGGEAALIAAGGSVLGIGNDMAGSLRIPAHFTGIFAHKPSRGLVPSDGSFPPESPNEPPEIPELKIYKHIYSGPLCRYAEDLIISMKCLSSTSGVTLNFDKKVDFRKIKICFLKEIECVFLASVQNDIINALEKVVSHFKNRYNINTQEVKLPFLHDVNRCLLSTLNQCVKKNVKELFLGSENLGFDERIDLLKAFIGKSVLCVPTLLAFNVENFPLIYKKDKTRYYQKMLEDWIKEFDKLLDENTILIMPSIPVVAPYNSEIPLLLLSVCYSFIFNVIGLPATQCPIGFTKQGLPYGIQVVGRANNDTLTIACALELERAFGGWKSPGEI